MDIYLETYVDEVMDKQVYRDGIGFSNFLVQANLFSKEVSCKY